MRAKEKLDESAQSKAVFTRQLACIIIAVPIVTIDMNAQVCTPEVPRVLYTKNWPCYTQVITACLYSNMRANVNR